MPRRVSALILAACALRAAPAVALDPTLILEPGFAGPLNAPQSTEFGVGGGGTLQGALGVVDHLQLQLDLGYHAFGGKAESTAGLFNAGVGPRVAWEIGQSGVSPWVDADALYAGSGGLSRFAWSAAVGVSYETSTLRGIGVFFRYEMVVAQSRAGYTGTNASLYMVGLSLELGSSRAVEAPPAPAASPAQVVAPAPAAATPAPPPPAEEEPEATADVTAAFKESAITGRQARFANGSAELSPQALKALARVARVLHDHPEVELVEVAGHTSATGGEEQNQVLSQSRADAVRTWLVAHGVAPERLKATGYGFTKPIASNDTPDGQEHNRRVEFHVVRVRSNATH